MFKKNCTLIARPLISGGTFEEHLIAKWYWPKACAVGAKINGLKPQGLVYLCELVIARGHNRKGLTVVKHHCPKGLSIPRARSRVTAVMIA